MVRAITKTIVTSLVGAALLAAGGTAGAGAGGGAPTTLHVGYPSGTYGYGYRATISGTQQQGNGKSQKVDQTLSARGTWRIALQTSQTGSGVPVTATYKKVHSTEAPNREMGPQKLVFSIAPNGLLTFREGVLPAPDTPSSAPGVDQFLALLPAHSVKPGATWTTPVSQPDPYGGGTIAYTANSTYLKAQKAHGAETAQVRTKARIPVDLDVNLTQAQGTATGSPAGGVPTAAHYQGTVSTTVTTVLLTGSHEVRQTKSESSVQLTETPLNGTTSSEPTSFKGTESITFNRVS